MRLPELRRLLDAAVSAWRPDAANRHAPFEPRELAAIDLAQRPVVLLGCGNEFAQDLIGKIGGRLDVVALLDNYRAGTVHEGRAVERDDALATLRKRQPDLVALNLTWTRAGHAYFEGLCRRHEVPCFSLLHAYRRLGLTTPYAPFDHQTDRTLAAIGPILATLDRWADEASAHTLVRVLLYRLTLERRYLHAVDLGNPAMYFGTGLFDLSDAEHFVDVGAYTGDSIDELCRHVGNWYRRIDAFEPDPTNLPALRRSVAHRRDVVVHECAVGDEPRAARLRSVDLNIGAGIASHLDDSGDISVEVRRLDDVVPAGVTLLKMDIEGGEASALRGAVATIQRDRPVLAIAAYHRPSDLADLPSQIRELDAGYDLYLRQHADFYWDTVLYAVPRA